MTCQICVRTKPRVQAELDQDKLVKQIEGQYVRMLQN